MIRLACVLVLLSTTAVLAQPREIVLKITAQQWTVINRAMLKAPLAMEETFPVLDDLSRQVLEQQKKPAEPKKEGDQ